MGYLTLKELFKSNQRIVLLTKQANKPLCFVLYRQASIVQKYFKQNW